jgi:hypothetical protein
MQTWALSSSGCEPNDAVSWITFLVVLLLIVAALLIAVEFGYVGTLVSGSTLAGGAVALIVICVSVDVAVIEPCRKAERKARAIARRSQAAAEALNSPASTPGAASESK